MGFYFIAIGYISGQDDVEYYRNRIFLKNRIFEVVRNPLDGVQHQTFGFNGGVSIIKFSQ
ncbi:hypothetical protein QUF82_02270 [Thiotrichales bacterium HSG14]|nr:hypothetical protein [Thiotrichales bacterium HSG14]